ncbi:MAG: hypothetical protein COT85_01065 [Chlamydiae bacterium CG10_big_fil_rev_8_21_14_0_10_42_34]|nr:MAG: hypothetical protein COT85_01065 [Chlamydiae bacterium CG10_big_fil_rev_8_21_14_0_10_42_34]
MEMSDISTYLLNFTESKKRIAIGTSSVIGGLALLIGYFQSGPSAMSYAETEAAFSKWEASPQDDTLYQGMLEALRMTPEALGKYDAAIAQKLLNTDKLSDALVMANRSLSRVKDDIPFHATYAATSLLIEQGSYQQALQDAVALKESMGNSYSSEFKGGSLLYAHNLLRIACLQQELNNRPGEKAAWEELEVLIDSKTPLSELILSSFSEKQINLSQYIADRKKAL